MRYTCFLALFVIALTANGQTDSIEKVLLLNKLKDKILTQEDFAKVFQKWKQTLKVAGAYPELPLDQHGEVHYSFVKSFDGVDDKLFNRTMEWLALYYGCRPSDMYSNKDDGKIIFQNSFTVNGSRTCIFTSAITIKGSKIRVQYVNLGYQTFYPGYFAGDTWKPEQTIYNPISYFFPIIEKNQSEWQDILNIFKITNQTINTDVGKLWVYIENYDQINHF